MATIYGSCRLCKTETELQDSHLVPTAVYRLLRHPEELNADPLHITKQFMTQSSTQARGHLFCAECEGRFSQRGEDWALRHCYRRNSGSFVLLDRLQMKEPEIEVDDYKVYSSTRVFDAAEIEMFTYFAMSLFWRATLDGWRNGRELLTKLSFGTRYEEEFRRYLLDEVLFPANAALCVILSNTHDDDKNQVAVFPCGGRLETYWQYRFTIPGVMIMLSLGGQIPELARKFCFFGSTSHPILVVDLFDHLVDMLGPLCVLTKPSQRLQKRYPNVGRT